MCRGKLLRSRTLARKVYKSLMSEGFMELKWTCPLCSYPGNVIPGVVKHPPQAEIALSRNLMARVAFPVQ